MAILQISNAIGFVRRGGGAVDVTIVQRGHKVAVRRECLQSIGEVQKIS